MTERGSLKRAVLDANSAPGARRFLADNRRLDPNAWRWPVIVDITTGCNLRCPFCWNEAPRKRELAEEAVLERLVSEVLPHAEDIAFGCRHEAALHPRLPDIVSRLDAERRRIGSDAKLVLLTSGSLLDAALRERLADCGLDFVLFSIDSTDPETFARLRPPSKWPAVRDKVAAFADVAPESLRLGAQALLLRATLPHLLSTMEELHGIGVRSFAVSQALALSTATDADVLPFHGPDRERIERTMTALAARARELEVELFLPELAPPAVDGELFLMPGQGRFWDESALRADRDCVCAAPWSRLRVDHRGEVYPCQFMLDPALSWGNLLDTPFADIVNGEEALRTREMLTRGEAPNAACRDCFFGPAPAPIGARR